MRLKGWLILYGAIGLATFAVYLRHVQFVRMFGLVSIVDINYKSWPLVLLVVLLWLVNRETRGKIGAGIKRLGVYLIRGHHA